MPISRKRSPDKRTNNERKFGRKNWPVQITLSDNVRNMGRTLTINYGTTFSALVASLIEKEYKIEEARGRVESRKEVGE